MRFELDCYDKGICLCGPGGVLWAPSTPLIFVFFEWWLPITPEFKLNSFFYNIICCFLEWWWNTNLSSNCSLSQLQLLIILTLTLTGNGNYREHINLVARWRLRPEMTSPFDSRNPISYRCSVHIFLSIADGFRVIFETVSAAARRVLARKWRHHPIPRPRFPVSVPLTLFVYLHPFES
jgi:hypothetical protein